MEAETRVCGHKPRTTGSHQKLEESGRLVSQKLRRRHDPADTLTSGTVRQYTAAVSRHSACGIWLRPPQETNHPCGEDVSAVPVLFLALVSASRASGRAQSARLEISHVVLWGVGLGVLDPPRPCSTPGAGASLVTETWKARGGGRKNFQGAALCNICKVTLTTEDGFSQTHQATPINVQTAPREQDSV